MTNPELDGDISQKYFTESIETLLEHAWKIGPAGEMQNAIGCASNVIHQLEKVEKGEITVVPPIDDNDLRKYHITALSIIGMGEKALHALGGTRKSRKQIRQSIESVVGQTLTKRALPAPSFRGEGSAVKS